MKRREFLLTTLGAGLVLGAGPALADFIGSPYFKDAEAKGDLPPVAERLPKNPAELHPGSPTQGATRLISHSPTGIGQPAPSPDVTSHRHEFIACRRP